MLLAPRLNLKWKGELIEDVITGLATMSLLIACTNNLHDNNLHDYKLHDYRSMAVRFLDSKPLLFLGTISYSLYLMHVPILGVVDIAIRAIALPPGISAALYVGGGAAASVGFSYLFYLGFERRFTTRSTNSRSVLS
jgi:peptidoglycan/LPS O-acetylase OafA/YrhL